MKQRNKFLKYYMHSMADEGGDEGGEDNGDTGDTSDGGGSGGGAGSGSDGGDVDWPTDWQSRLAKGDEKVAKQFGRFQSPEALAEAYIAASRKISSGGMVPKLGDSPTVDEINEYRKAAGIPESPDKYVFENIEDDDKPFVEAFAAKAHEMNMTPAQAKSAIDWFMETQNQVTESRLEQDEQDKTSAYNQLAGEWTPPKVKEYTTRINNLLDRMPESIRDDLKSARMPDGTAIMNNPDVLRGLLAIDLDLNPARIVSPTGDSMKGINSEIEDIEKVMRTRRHEYNKDEGMQARYRELLEAREKLQKRSA